MRAFRKDTELVSGLPLLARRVFLLIREGSYRVIVCFAILLRTMLSSPDV
jgi:hypothetical protein